MDATSGTSPSRAIPLLAQRSVNAGPPRADTAPSAAVPRGGGAPGRPPALRRRAAGTTPAPPLTIGRRQAVPTRVEAPVRRATRDLPVVAAVPAVVATSPTNPPAPGAAAPVDTSSAPPPATTARRPAAAPSIQRALTGPAASVLPFPTPPTQAGSGPMSVPAQTQSPEVAQPASPAAPSTSEVLDRFDELVDRLEERVLAEIERRGGRYTGVF